jgi:hypothetical protein
MMPPYPNVPPGFVGETRLMPTHVVAFLYMTGMIEGGMKRQTKELWRAE